MATKSKSKAATGSTTRKISKSKSSARSARASSKAATGPHTKQDRIIAMLRRSAGATIGSLMVATGWQQHSVRGFLAGVVRKKLGLNLTSENTDKRRIYRIKDTDAAPAAAERGKKAA
jgi:Protein of unknown function (DUF3489)